MTKQQVKQLNQVREQLESIRETLDEIMYGTYLEEPDFQKVNKCHEFICKATDQI